MVIYVTAANSSATVEDPNGKVLFHAPVTSGSQHDPLPIGKWTVTGVEQMPAFNYNPELFWDADPKHAKARIPPARTIRSVLSGSTFQRSITASTGHLSPRRSATPRRMGASD